jgi:hypothetical protein
MPTRAQCKNGHEADEASLRLSAHCCQAVCKRCKVALDHKVGIGWCPTGQRKIKSPFRSHKLAAPFVVAAVLLSPSHSLMANQDEPTFNQASLAADAYEREFRRQGMHCRSTLHGSSESAVAQIREGLDQEETLHLQATTISPVSDGKHILRIVYSARRNSRLIKLEEAHGWIDHANCNAHLL